MEIISLIIALLSLGGTCCVCICHGRRIKRLETSSVAQESRDAKSANIEIETAGSTSLIVKNVGSHEATNVIITAGPEVTLKDGEVRIERLASGEEIEIPYRHTLWAGSPTRITIGYADGNGHNIVERNVVTR